MISSFWFAASRRTVEDGLPVNSVSVLPGAMGTLEHTFRVECLSSSESTFGALRIREDRYGIRSARVPTDRSIDTSGLKFGRCLPAIHADRFIRNVSVPSVPLQL
jgi:hypothetical protein